MWTEVKNSQGNSSLNPVISTQDHGFLVGDGIFETLQTKSGQILSLERHLQRLSRSSQIVGLGAPPIAEIHASLQKLRSENSEFHSKQGRLRITVTSGIGELGSARNGDWSLIVSWSTANAWPASALVHTSKVVRYSAAATKGAKTTSYIENVIALQAARAAGFDEAIMLNESGFLTEGTGSNIFLIQGTSVLTPNLNSGALGGITREVLLEAFPQIEEVDLTIDQINDSDAAFLTSSTRDLQPISQWGEKEFRLPNEVFNKLQLGYLDAIKSEWT